MLLFKEKPIRYYIVYNHRLHFTHLHTTENQYYENYFCVNINCNLYK